MPSSRRERRIKRDLHKASKKSGGHSRPHNGKAAHPARQGRPQHATSSKHQPPVVRELGGVVEGVLQLKGRVGFILAEGNKAADVLVEGPTLRLAMNGDRVR